jgi:hypothetical protein
MYLHSFLLYHTICYVYSMYLHFVHIIILSCIFYVYCAYYSIWYTIISFPSLSFYHLWDSHPPLSIMCLFFLICIFQPIISLFSFFAFFLSLPFIPLRSFSFSYCLISYFLFLEFLLYGRNQNPILFRMNQGILQQNSFSP